LRTGQPPQLQRAGPICVHGHHSQGCGTLERPAYSDYSLSDKETFVIEEVANRDGGDFNLIKTIATLTEVFFAIYKRETISGISNLIGQPTVNKNLKLWVVMVSERLSLRTQSFL